MDSCLPRSLADHPAILVGTAHQLQGLERPAVIALLAMIGYRTAEDTILGAGKTFVTLSRNRPPNASSPTTNP